MIDLNMGSNTRILAGKVAKFLNENIEYNLSVNI